MDRDLYYRYSGQFPLHAPLVMLAAVVPVMAIVGVVYGIAVAYCPIVYVNLLGTLGVGFLSGWLVRQLGMKLDVRNPLIYHALGFVGGFVGLYASWVAWILKLSDWSIIIVGPTALFETAMQISEQGVWSLRGSSDPVKGIVLQLVWLAEAATILITPLAVAMKMRDEAYCETTGCWLKEKRVFGPLTAIDDLKTFRQQLETEGFTQLGQFRPLPHAPAVGDRYTTLELRHAGTPESTHLLRVESHEVKPVKKKQMQIVHKVVVRNMLIDRATHDLIVEILAAPRSAI